MFSESAGLGGMDSKLSSTSDLYSDMFLTPDVGEFFRPSDRLLDALSSNAAERVARIQPNGVQDVAAEIASSSLSAAVDDLQTSPEAYWDIASTLVSTDIATAGTSHETYGRQRSTTTSPSIGEEHPSEFDEIRPPETRIHDTLIWDDGEWYRERAIERAILVVDYLFLEAKSNGELAHLSSEKITIWLTFLAFSITLDFTSDLELSLAMCGAICGIVPKFAQLEKYRHE